MRLRIVLFVAVWLSLTALSAYQPDWVWMQRTYGSGNCIVYDLDTDAQGRIIAVGAIDGEVIIGDHTINTAGTRDGLLCVLDADGNWLWSMAIGGSGADYAHRVTTDPEGNIYLAGGFSESFTLGTYDLTCNGGNDLFFAKLDPSGNVISAASVGSTYQDTLSGIAVTPAGEVYVAGIYRGAITIGTTTLTTPSYGLFYSKWSPTFEPLWANQGYSSYPSIECVNIGSDPSGNLILIGNFSEQCAFGSPNPVTLYNQNIGGYVVKLSPTGNAIWGESVSLSNFGITNSYIDHAGNSYISGDMCFIIEKDGTRLDNMPRCGKLSSNGTWAWYEPFADMQSCVYVRITGDQAGNAYLTGILWGSFDFGGYVLNGDFDNENIFVAKGDPSGNWQWGLQTVDSGTNFYLMTTDITALPSGDCVFAGFNSDENQQFGDFLVPPSETNYAFFIRVDQDTSVALDDPTSPALPELSLWPNPSTGSVNFRLSDSRKQLSSAKVYNVRGQLIRRISTLDDPTTLSWDGLDDQGKPTQPGVYILSVSSGKETFRKVFTRLP